MRELNRTVTKENNVLLSSQHFVTIIKNLNVTKNNRDIDNTKACMNESFDTYTRTKCCSEYINYEIQFDRSIYITDTYKASYHTILDSNIIISGGSVSILHQHLLDLLSAIT